MPFLAGTEHGCRPTQGERQHGPSHVCALPCHRARTHAVAHAAAHARTRAHVPIRVLPSLNHLSPCIMLRAVCTLAARVAPVSRSVAPTAHTMFALPRVAVASASTSPAYTITEVEPESTDAGRAAVKRGWYVLKGIRGHTKKLNPIARQIAGKSVNEALTQMAFSQQKRAASARSALERACQNADFYHSLSSDQLMVERAWTGKHMTSMRIRYHSKGRAGRAYWRTSMLTVRLREMTPAEQLKKNRFGAKPSAAVRAKLDPHGY